MTTGLEIRQHGSDSAVVFDRAETELGEDVADVLGTAATVAGGLIVARALALPLPSVSFATLGLIAGGGFPLILAATVVPAAAALRHEIPRTLAVE